MSGYDYNPDSARVEIGVDASPPSCFRKKAGGRHSHYSKRFTTKQMRQYRLAQRVNNGENNVKVPLGQTVSSFYTYFFVQCFAMNIVRKIFRHYSCNMRDRLSRGITLMEMLTVIAIMAMLAAIVLPVLSKGRVAMPKARF